MTGTDRVVNLQDALSDLTYIYELDRARGTVTFAVHFEASLIQRGDAQVVVMGPGFLSLTAHIYQSFPGPPPNLALLDSANVRMALRPAGSDRSIAMGVALDRVSTQLNPRDDELGRWIYQERRPHRMAALTRPRSYVPGAIVGSRQRQLPFGPDERAPSRHRHLHRLPPV